MKNMRMFLTVMNAILVIILAILTPLLESGLTLALAVWLAWNAFVLGDE